CRRRYLARPGRAVRIPLVRPLVFRHSGCGALAAAVDRDTKWCGRERRHKTCARGSPRFRGDRSVIHARDPPAPRFTPGGDRRLTEQTLARLPESLFRIIT